MLLGQSRGSVGDVTFSRLKGQQIAKARNRNPHNPRTFRQSFIRAQFAAAVKFFTRGNQALFVYAFENKKSDQSDYNAFVSANVRRAPVISRRAFDNYDYPVLAPFVMSKGSLTPVDVINNGTSVQAVFSVAMPATVPTTVGTLSAALIAGGEYQEGDILTLVLITSSYSGTYPSAEADGTGKPSWLIKQLIIDSTSEATLADTIGMTAVAYGEEGAQVLSLSVAGISATLSAATLIHTRPTSSGLKASTQELVLNGAASTAYEAAQQDAYQQSAVSSWMVDGTVDAQPEEILQGSIAYGDEQ